MTSRPSVTRRIAAGLLVSVMGAWAAGCGDSAEPQAQHDPAAPPVAPDISRISEVQKDFPPEFTVKARPTKTLGQPDIERAGIHILSEAQIDPPHCLPAMIPPYANLTVGIQAAGVTASGELGGVHVLALRLPKPVPAGQPPPGCEHITVSGSPKANGTAELIPGPEIDGVKTTGVKLVASGQDDPDYIYREDPDYIFTAALDDTTTAVVRGSLAPRLNPPQFLSDLLVKAVAAVRGP